MRKTATTLLNTLWLWLVVCCFALAPGVAGATGRAERSLKQAQQQIAEGEFDRARETLVHARGQTDKAALLGQIEYHLSLVWHTLDEPPKAERAMRRALSHTPDLEPDPDRFKPSFVALFYRVRQTLKGSVLVTSNLPAARVVVDGRPGGSVPYRATLVIGAHTIEVHAKGSAPHTERVAVHLDRETRLHATLRPEVVKSPTKKQGQQHAPDVGSSSPRLFWTWIAAAGTAVATAAVIGFGAAAVSSHSEGEDLGAQRPFDSAAYADAVDSLDRHRWTTNISLGIAGALAITTVALYFWERGRGRSEPGQVGLGTTLGGRRPRVDLSVSF